MIDSGLSSAQLVTLKAEANARAVFADALTEGGDPRGEFINVQLRLSGHSLDPKERKKLVAREKQLLTAHGAKWLKGFPKNTTPELQRGFIGHVAANATFVKPPALAKVAALAPLLDSLELFGSIGGLAGIYLAPELESARVSQLEILTSAVHSLWPRLRALNIHNLHLTDEELAKWLAACPELTSLEAHSNLLGFASAKRLAPLRFTTLSLANNRLGSAGGKVLLERPSDDRLVHLNLANNGLSGASFEKARGLQSLESLDLSRNAIGRVGLEVLLGLQPPKLRALGLSQTGLDDASIALLPRLTAFAQLERLDISKNTFKEKTLKHLFTAGSPHLKISAAK